VRLDAAFKYGKAFKVSPIWIRHGIAQEESIDTMLEGQPPEVRALASDATLGLRSFPAPAEKPECPLRAAA
jgi:hypothetical protein